MSARNSVIIQTSGCYREVESLQAAQRTPVAACREKKKRFLVLVVELVKDFPEPGYVLVGRLDADVPRGFLQALEI